MATVPLVFGPDTDTAKSTAGGGTTLINAYVEPTIGGKTAYSINTDPGLNIFSTIGTGLAGRGIFPFGNVLYAVQGEKLYSVTVTGTATLVGTIPGTLPVNFSQNMRSPNNQITIVADSTVWFVENGSLNQVTDPDLPAGVTASSQLNGFTFYTLLDARVFSSNINDTATVNALNFDQAQKYADQGVRGFIVGEEFWYFGTGSLEVYRYIGGTGFPLQRMQGVGLGEGGGCAAKNSIVIMDNAPFLVSDKRMVVRYNGYTPVRVSHSAVERDIDIAINQGYANQITAFSFAMNGHQFYVMRSPLWCWVYDAMSQKWHKKTSYLSNTWICGFYAFAFGKHLVQDATDGKIYEMTLSASDENGQPLIMKAKSQIVSAAPNSMICDAVSIDLQSGTGNAAGSNSDQVAPRFMFKISRDGGKTFEDRRMAETGQQADWDRNVRILRLGRIGSAGLVVEISASTPVERAVFQGFAAVRKLAV